MARGTGARAIERRAQAAATRELTATQRRFVDALAENAAAGGPLAEWECARAAGYTGADDTLRVTAARTKRLPHVRAYLLTRLRETVEETMAPEALRTLATLQRDGKSEETRARIAQRVAESAGILAGQSDQGRGGPGIVVKVELRHVSAGALDVQTVDTTAREAEPASAGE